MNPTTAVNMILALLGAPLLTGIIQRTKAFFAGRRGPPLLQPYFDLWKLLHKGAVYSTATTWVFRAGPPVGLAAVLAVLTLVPLGGADALVAFPGDLVLFAYLLGLLRFLTILAALDTTSSFEGMGASREAWFSALAEPALFLALAVVARKTEAVSLSSMFASIEASVWIESGPALVLVTATLFVVLLAENCRIPVDDPSTHLELTMIHEVMVLDHGGIDFAFISYGAALKLWVFASLVVSLTIPFGEIDPWTGTVFYVLGILVLGMVVGTVESTMARLRLQYVPQLLVGASVLSATAFALVIV
jgi:formate hydrogenlyase subunit 4